MDIVRFKGGLGNQMFQYAFLRTLQVRGREAKASLGFYANNPHAMSFCLTDVFENVKIDNVDESVFRAIDMQWKKIKEDDEQRKAFIQDYAKRFFWVEEDDGQYVKEVFDTNACTFVGYWQTEKYFCENRENILNDFTFRFGEKKLEELKREIANDEKSVSVHIRRGDYLNFQSVYGHICNEKYYKSALDMMKDLIETPSLYFFSDDIEWVKMHYPIKGATYICESMFEKYRDWYDMQLMSVCKHNIIANSSFSWWGAWLNQNVNKVVIAPNKWMNGVETPDIWCENWHRI